MLIGYIVKMHWDLNEKYDNSQTRNEFQNISGKMAAILCLFQNVKCKVSGCHIIRLWWKIRDYIFNIPRKWSILKNGIECVSCILPNAKLTDEKSTLFQVMPWCRQASSHCLSQCRSRSVSPYGWHQYMMMASNGNIFRVTGSHRAPVESPHKGQWRGTSIFSLICALTND